MPERVRGGNAAVVSQLQAAGCVFAEEEAEILVSAARSPSELSEMVDDRVRGTPLEHVVGSADFCGLKITVQPGVFVPRRRTEFLVRQAAVLAPPRAVVVDLCCGSGAIGAALQHLLGQLELYAADLDPAAVRCARLNLPDPAVVLEGDLFNALPVTLQGRVDLLVANVPYVPAGEIALLPAEARDHEARLALDGGTDGLEVFRRVVAGAPRWLAPTGRLLVELTRRQVARAVFDVTAGGMLAQVTFSNEHGAAVVIAGLAAGRH